MNKTIGIMLEGESAFGAVGTVLNENAAEYGEIEQVNEAQLSHLVYGPEKVIVNKVDESFLIEFSNNLERYMEDAKMYTLEEAIEKVAEANDIPEEDIAIVVDESCMSKIDLKDLKEKYEVLKK